MVDINDYIELRECIYKDEHYSVRDNGAVMRHSQEGKKVRKLDNIWTFGKPNVKSGYMEIAGESVHRIVAFAFHGNPPSKEFVVDHIDTNRRNNRPENLRWLTRLENVLNNPITRARIENICGSVEEFLKNPSILYGREHVDPNFSWMRSVTKEEAKVTLENMMKWVEQGGKSNGTGGLGEWVMTKVKEIAPEFSNIERGKTNISQDVDNANKNFEREKYTPIQPVLQPYSRDEENISRDTIDKSITPNVLQVNWGTPTEFPCCPQGEVESPLEEYKLRLTKDAVFTKNRYGEMRVVEAEMTDKKDALYVISKGEGIKPWSLVKITYKDGIFYHESKHMFFEEVGARKYFTLGLNREWTGGDVFDDFC